MAIKDETKKIEPIEIDINDASLIAGDALNLDLNEDWQAQAAPPPAGKYRLKLTLDDTKIIVGQKQNFAITDPNGKYYNKQVTCKIQLPGNEFDQAFVYYKAASTPKRGKKLSTMAGLLIKMGAKLKPNMSELEVAKLFIAVVNKHEPELIADCDWRAWDKEGEGEFGEILLEGMKNFPMINGVRQHIILGAKKQQVIPKLVVKDWLGKPGAAAPKPVVSQPKPVVVAAPVAVEMDLSGGVDMGDDGEVILDLA